MFNQRWNLAALPANFTTSRHCLRTSRLWWITQSTQRHRRGCNTTNWVHLMANNSSSAFASDGKINTAFLNFGDANRLCLFCLEHEVVSILPHKAILPHEAKQNVWFCMGGSGLDWTDGFKKFCGLGLDRIQLLRIRIRLGLKNFTVRSSLLSFVKVSIKTACYLKLKIHILTRNNWHCNFF